MAKGKFLDYCILIILLSLFLTSIYYKKNTPSLHFATVDGVSLSGEPFPYDGGEPYYLCDIEGGEIPIQVGYKTCYAFNVPSDKSYFERQHPVLNNLFYDPTFAFLLLVLLFRKEIWSKFKDGKRKKESKTTVEDRKRD